MKKLTEEDYKQVSEETGLEVALIKTVAAVEGSGSGFDPNGIIKILFEGHVFYRKLARYGINPANVAIQDPTICYKIWTKQHYAKTNLGEWMRLERAQKIQPEAANMSASWGLFQVLGENYASAGYKTVSEMVESYEQSEANQLRSFIAFIESQKIIQYLVAKDWANFALRYNGKGYKANKYDEKLAEAYKKFAKLV